MQLKDYCNGQIENLQQSVMDSQWLRTTKGRELMPKMLYTQQSEPQQADLNVRANTLAIWTFQQSTTPSYGFISEWKAQWFPAPKVDFPSPSILDLPHLKNQ